MSYVQNIFIFNTSDTAMLLLRDPKSDRVPLLKHFHMAPFIYCDQNSLTHELVLGNNDACKTLREAARRGVREEENINFK